LDLLDIGGYVGFYINENGEITEITNEKVDGDTVFRLNPSPDGDEITGEFTFYRTKQELESICLLKVK
jgi:hypothetical protein